MDASPASPSQDEKTWGMLCHLLALTTCIGVPFGSILGPLVMWLIKKNESAFVDQHGREALNFGISTTIYAIVFVLLCFVFVGFVLLPALFIFWIIYVIVSAIKASDGKTVFYPLTIRFL